MKGVGKMVVYGAFLEAALLVALAATAQDGTTGINSANTTIRNYFPALANLMYAIGAILGIVGAIRVYSLWVGGDPHTWKVAAAWFSSCIFLVIVVAVIQAFFGI